jgi:hypothetical protein
MALGVETDSFASIDFHDLKGFSAIAEGLFIIINLKQSSL